MYEIILVILSLCLFAVSVSCLFGKLWMLFFLPKKRKSQYCVIYLDSIDDEKQIVYYTEKLKWYGKLFADKLVFVFKDEVLPSYRKLAQGLDDVIFCSRSEWIEYYN